MEQEESSLYKFKAKVYDLDETDEEQEEREMAEWFTNFDHEYQDVDSDDKLGLTSMEDKKRQDGSKKLKASDPFKIAESDVNHLCRVHDFLVSCIPSASQVVATLHQVAPPCKEETFAETKMIVEGYNVAVDLVNTGDISGKFVAG